MLLKPSLKVASFLAVAFALSGCGLFNSNPTQGIALITKNCYARANQPANAPLCLPGSNLTITPYVPVWGNETGDYYNDSTNPPLDETQGTVSTFGNNGLQPLLTPLDGPLVVNNAMAPAWWNVYWLEPWSCGYNNDPEAGPFYIGQAYYDTDYYYGDGYEYEVLTSELNTPNQQPIPNYYSTKNGLELDCYIPPHTSSPLPLDSRS